MAEGRYLDVKKDYKTTLGELLDKYEENFKDQASFITWKSYCLGNFREYFGETTLLNTIRYVDLETYRNRLKQKLTRNKKIRSVASINREMSCLHHVFSKAVELEMVEENPFERGKSLILKENNQRVRFLSQKEINKLLDECPKYLRQIVVCALNTGMRRGEILNLKWEQIRNGFIYLRKTKSNEAREIPLNNTLEALFREIRKERHLKSEYVFTYKDRPLHGLKKSFSGALKRAGIEDFRFHDLRHTFASHLIMSGASIKDVQELLGHKDTKMTNRYAHLSPEHKKKAVNLLNELTASENSDCHNNVTFSGSEISRLP